jgi:putative aldouronate transport system substrate-binding protein
MDKENQHHLASESYSRRHFMQLAAATTAGGILLAACGNDQPTQLKAAPIATTLPQNEINATSTASVGKTYFPGGAPHVPDAYTAVPPAFQSVKYIPGSGDTVKVFEVFYGTPSVPQSQNKFWQTLNKTLNINYQATQVVFDDYITKSTVMLNSNKPDDLFLILDGQGTYSVYQTALQQGAFNDLTSFLSGDGLKEFPNLALIAPTIWHNSKYQGKIYAVPRPRVELDYVMFYRKDLTDKLGLGVPQNPAEFYKWLVTISQSNLNGKSKKVYGFGGRAFFGQNEYILSIFGCPYNWQVESDGSFTYYIETDQFKQALAFERSLWAAGVYHPDSPVMTNKQAKTGFESGQYVCYQDGFSAVVGEQFRSHAVDPNAEVRLLVPFNNQGTCVRHLGVGYFGKTGIPTNATSDPERIKELLHVLDYISAPPFSVENNFLTYGINGWDSTIGANGIRQLTDKGRNEIGEMLGISSPPQVLYNQYDPPRSIPIQNDVRQWVKDAVPDASWGLSSPTFDAQNTTLLTYLTSGFQRIVRGQDPLSALPTVIQQWRSQGGAKIKQELAASYSKTK